MAEPEMGRPESDDPPGGGVPHAARNPLDWVLLAMGVLALVFSLLAFYTVKGTNTVLTFTHSWNAWHGIFGWFAALIAFLGSTLVALEIFAPGQLVLRWPTWDAVTVMFGVSALGYLIAWFVTPIDNDAPGYTLDFGRGIGFYGGLVFAIVGVAAGVLRSRAGTRSPV